MVRAAGIDVSSRAIAIVTVPLDPELDHTIDGAPGGATIPLHGPTALERACYAAGSIPRGSFWDDIAEVAIERPYGTGPDALLAMHLMVGLLVAAMPERLHPPLLLQPNVWRKHAGLSGKAEKEDVLAFAIEHMPRRPASQDVADAFCIARAARSLNLERLRRAA